MLQDISSDIASGRPIWGLMRCNEYFDSSHPLGKGLRARARRELSAQQIKPSHQADVEALLQGKKSQEFDRDQRAEIVAYDKKLPVKIRRTTIAPKSRRKSTYFANEKKKLYL